MSSVIASMNDAKEYFERLPSELESYFDERYQNEFETLMDALGEFFNITAAIDVKADNAQVIPIDEVSDIGGHGLTLILKMVDLMRQLDLSHKRQEIEQMALIFATWTMQYDGKINFLEPIVNAFAQASNSLTSQKSLEALGEIMSEVVLACSDDIKQDFDSTNLYRPWRLLLINRGIVATRTHKAPIMMTAFDDLVRYLPQEASSFFKQSLLEVDEKNYPPKVKEMLQEYNNRTIHVRLH
jgi:hypothetical protein